MGITTVVESILPPPFEWCYVPQGFVTLRDATKYNFRGTAGSLFYVMPFFIAKYPITNIQFQMFLDADDGWKDNRWWKPSTATLLAERQYPRPSQMGISSDSNLPYGYLNWFEAYAFCLWLSNRTQLQISLPTEQQWQLAAQGEDNRKFPWGSEIRPKYCNYFNNVGHLTPVNHYPAGISPYGVMDMSGNAAEWCLNDWRLGLSAYGYGPAKAVRGGSWYDLAITARVYDRRYADPYYHSYAGGIGFRIVMNG